MKQRSRSSWLVAIVVLFVVTLTGKAQQAGTESESVRPTEVSMVALIAMPEKYDGKPVRLRGFLCLEFEGDALYLHEEDYRYGLTKNSFALRISKTQREKFKGLNLKYVVIDGTIFAKGLESTDAWSGAIGNITRLEAWPIDRRAVPHQ